MGAVIEIRHVDRNTVILWASVGQNIFAFQNGSYKSRALYSKIVDFQNGARLFKNLEELYSWAIDFIKP